MCRSCSLSWPTSIDLVISDKTWNISLPYFTCHWTDNSSPDWAWQAAEKGPGGQTLCADHAGGFFSSRAHMPPVFLGIWCRRTPWCVLCKMCESESEFFTAARAHGHVIKCDIEGSFLDQTRKRGRSPTTCRSQFYIPIKRCWHWVRIKFSLVSCENIIKYVAYYI